MPKILFVAMGLQDSPLAPGWWNGYHDSVFLHNNFNVEISKEIGEKMVKKELKRMQKDPRYGFSFFSQAIFRMERTNIRKYLDSTTARIGSCRSF